MTILSDKTIRTLIEGGILVPGGNAECIDNNSYHFTAGVAFKAGSEQPAIDFSASDAEVIIAPGEMVWIRTKSAVSLPADVAGFWWQTNALSRKGLMLVNMSMVEPGYVGPLACLFVNFGKQSIVIQSETTIAKMVFIRIDGEVETPSAESPPVTQYDHTLRELSLGQPTTFLQIADLAVHIREARQQAIQGISDEAARARETLGGELQSLRQAEVTAFKQDTTKSVRSAFGLAVLAVILLTFADMGAGWLKGEFSPDTKGIAREQAESVLSERVRLPAQMIPAEQAALIKQIEAMRARLEVLEAKQGNQRVADVAQGQ